MEVITDAKPGAKPPIQDASAIAPKNNAEGVGLMTDHNVKVKKSAKNGSVTATV